MKNNWLWKFFTFWINVSVEYDKLKENPETREKSVQMGVKSLVMSIVGLITTVGFAFLAYVCFAGVAGSGLAGLLELVGGIICAIIALVCLIDLVFASLMYAIYQRKLNKKPVGVAALTISLTLIIATIAAVVVAVLVLVNQ